MFMMDDYYKNDKAVLFLPRGGSVVWNSPTVGRCLRDVDFSVTGRKV